MKGSRTSLPPKNRIGQSLWRNKRIIIIFLIVVLLNGFIVSLLLRYLSSRTPSSVKYHLSCPYESGIYQHDDKTIASKINAKAVIVPHHLLAANLIDEALGSVNPDEIKTVILAGPNHMELSNDPVATSLYPWKTISGSILPDNKLIIAMTENNLASVNEPVFYYEHSVCGLVTFIKNYFPGAKIIPLAIKSNAPEDQLTGLGRMLGDKCADCLLIGSIDFSHEVSETEALENDRKSINALLNIRNMDSGTVTADSLPSLRLIYHYLSRLGINKGIFLRASNSYEITGKNRDRVTSYITVIY